MRIYKDLEMVKHLGSGIPRILQTYSEDSFKLTDNFLRMTFKSAIQDKLGDRLGDKLSKNKALIIELMKNNPKITISELGKEINQITSRRKQNGTFNI